METHTQQDSHPRAIVLDVGHGSCVVLTDSRSTTVIDAGSGSALMEFLVQAGISQINSVALSHADSDHIGALVAIFSSGKFTVSEIWLNSDAIKTTRAWENLKFEIQRLEESGELIVHAGIAYMTEIRTGVESFSIKALAPRRALALGGAGSRDEKRRLVTSNGSSAVLMVYSDKRPLMLLPGDMDAVGFDSLKSTKHDLRADYLVLPHHGGQWGGNTDAGSLVSELCSLVSPKEVVVSNGRNKHGNPIPMVVEAVRRSAPLAYISCTQLSTNCFSGPLIPPNNTNSDVYSSGHEKNTCCSGSVVLNMATIPMRDVSPHKDFVDQFADTALCRKTPSVGGA